MPVCRIAVLGNHTPRQCGIAAFTEDLAEALAQERPDADVMVVAMNDGQAYAYPARVQLTVEQDDLDAYEMAADDLNARAIDVLSVQHEFGIFGGPAGSYLLALLRRVRAPVVTTLHTVLECFTAEQLAVVEELALLSAKIVVMSERAVRFLVTQGVPRREDRIHPSWRPRDQCRPGGREVTPWSAGAHADPHLRAAVSQQGH